MGRSAHDLFHHSPGWPALPGRENAGLPGLAAGREWRADDETYWHADGHAVPVALASHPDGREGPDRRRRGQRGRRQRPACRAQAREQALVAAENLARARSEFLANMSHEIRTPDERRARLCPDRPAQPPGPRKARNAFEKILASGKQLLGVVNEILDFSKIDAGKLQIEAREMSLGDVLDAPSNSWPTVPAPRAWTCAWRRPPTCRRCIGDPLRLGQVLLNLLGNAVKFTDAGSVTLSGRLQGGQLVFRVTDTGIGMTPNSSA
jgi:signal transduction histidine kinase